MIWAAEQTDYFADCLVEGMEIAFPERWKKFSGDKNSAVLVRTELPRNRPALVISGGAGSGPLFPAYVTDGLADAAAMGGPFGAPNAYSLYEAGKYLGKEQGVLFVYNNFAGDFLNNDMAVELLEMDGIAAMGVAAADDMGTAIGESRENRGGRCGIALLIKLASACFSNGYTLPQTAEILTEVNQRMATVSVMVDFKKKRIDYGKGFSGEPGFRTETHMNMEKTAEECMDMLLQDLTITKQEQPILLLNRLRATSYVDGYRMLRHAVKYLAKQVGKPPIARVGNYSNIVDEYGVTFTILCASDEIVSLLKPIVGTDSFWL